MAWYHERRGDPADMRERPPLYGAGAAGAAAEVARKRINFPPQYFPPAGALPFTLTGWNDFAAPGTATPTALQATAPDGYAGIIRVLSLYANDMVATSDINWTLFINGSPTRGYTALTIFPRAAAFASVGDDTAIEIPSDGKILISITKVDAAVQKVGASLVGWWYPVEY